MTTTAKDIALSAVRMDNDINGNPRYYFPVYMFPRMEDKKRRQAGLTTYRGKRYGAGYVMQSYSLEHDISFVLKTLAA